MKSKTNTSKFACLIVTFGLLTAFTGTAQKWKNGILTDEFIFTTAPFPESHAATLAETPDGIVAAWFGGTKERNPDVGIWMSRKDKNNQWDAPVEVANGIVNDTLRYACWNPVLYQIPRGDLLLFYKVGPNVAGWKGFLMRSSDHGKNWSKPEALPEGYLGPVKNKPILFENGELWCPSSTEGDQGWRVHFEITPDGGRTWRKTAPINDGKDVNAIQPSLVNHKNGNLQVLCRSKNRAIMESWSKDGGVTWSPMQASSLPNNNSGTDAIALKDGRSMVVYNHVKTPEQERKGSRTPLNVAISPDGKRWEAALILEDSPISQYSYPSILQSADGLIHIVYTWRRERIKYVKIDPSKLITEPILNELWP